MKRLAVFLDGTWNDPGDNTNVWRLRSMLSRVDDHGVEQLAYYDTGVGTRWYDRVRGGAAGVGLSRNIREAYRWLVENYDDGDEIYIFGFSRDAQRRQRWVRHRQQGRHGLLTDLELVAPQFRD